LKINEVQPDLKSSCGLWPFTANLVVAIAPSAQRIAFSPQRDFAFL